MIDGENVGVETIVIVFTLIFLGVSPSFLGSSREMEDFFATKQSYGGIRPTKTWGDGDGYKGIVQEI